MHPPPLSFSVNLVNFHRDICAKFDITNLPQSPDTGQNSDGDISDFQISGQSLMNENCHKSRTSHDIDIKLRPVTKLSKKNAATSKIFEEDIMSINCDVIVIFLIYGQFGAIHKPDFRCVACKTYISININLLSHKY